MTAGDYRWVCTDRRSEADVLKEIAEADTPLLVVSRDEPSERTLQRMSGFPQRAAEMNSPSSLLSVVTSPDDVVRQTLKDNDVCPLVASPWQFLCIFDFETDAARRVIDPPPSTLHEWFLARAKSAPCIPGQASQRPRQIRMLREHVPRKLVPSKPNLSDFLRSQIEQLFASKFRAGNINAVALKAGVLLWHDALDESHECAQSIEGKGWKLAGDYWHAIMHRREPDYGNSKYWFRRVGEHPIFPELSRRTEPVLAAAAPEWKDRLLKNGWDPFAFVDFCETMSAGNHPEWEAAAEEIQELEMLLLLDSTYRDAHF